MTTPSPSHTRPPGITREQLAWYRDRFEHNRTVPPGIVAEMFRIIEHNARVERARVADILRRESANGDYGDKYTDGLLLAAQLVEALTDETGPDRATLKG